MPVKPTMPNKRPIPETRKVIVGIISTIPVIIRKTAFPTFCRRLCLIAKKFNREAIADRAETVKSCVVFVDSARYKYRPAVITNAAVRTREMLNAYLARRPMPRFLNSPVVVLFISIRSLFELFRLNFARHIHPDEAALKLPSHLKPG